MKNMACSIAVLLTAPWLGCSSGTYIVPLEQHRSATFIDDCGEHKLRKRPLRSIGLVRRWQQAALVR